MAAASASTAPPLPHLLQLQSMAAPSASTAPPLGETPAPFVPEPDPRPPSPLPSAERVRELSSRYLSAPLPAQAPRLSASSPHSASVPPPARAQHQNHHHRGTPAPTPFVFGLADENRSPPTPGSRKGGAALNPPATPLAAGASRATAAHNPRRILRTPRASANVATAALEDRSGCSVRPAMPVRTPFSFRSASPQPSLAPTPYPRRAPCSEDLSPLQMTEGSRRPQNPFCPFCFRAFDSALSDCQPTLSRALVKPGQPPAQKVKLIKKGAVMGSNKAVGQQADVHRLRILDRFNMQHRFMNAWAQELAIVKNAAAEAEESHSASLLRVPAGRRRASPQPSLGPTPYPRRAPCSEVQSPLQMTEGSRRLQNPFCPFCFRAFNPALSDCQPTLSRALVKPGQPPEQKVELIKKGAVMGSNKPVGKQADVHRLRILDRCNMQHRFLNAWAQEVAIFKNAAAEAEESHSASFLPVPAGRRRRTALEKSLPMALSYRTSGFSESTAPETNLEWVMFDRRVIQGEFPFSSTEATAKTSNNKMVRVSLRLAPPPLTSYVQLYTDDRVYGGPPTVVSADGDLLLIHMVVAVPNENPSDFTDNYFVYQASPEQPWLYALPTLGDDCFDRYQPTGVFHSGGDSFFAANLHRLVGEDREEVAELFRYSSYLNEWKLFRIDCREDARNGFCPVSWHSDAVFCYGNYMYWADYHQGMVYCDISADEIDLQFLRFPGIAGIECHLAISEGRGLPERFRNVSVIRGKICFVNIENGRLFQNGGMSDCSISVWTLQTSELKWEKEHSLMLSDLWSLVKYQQSPLPRSVPKFPMLDLNKNGVVHFIVSESSDSMLDWILTINIRSLALDYKVYLNMIEDPNAREDVKNTFWNNALLSSNVCRCLSLFVGCC